MQLTEWLKRKSEDTVSLAVAEAIVCFFVAFLCLAIYLLR